MIKNRSFFCLLICAFTALQLSSFAQAPQGISYQAIARDDKGKELSEQPIGVKINVRQGSASGTIIYSETHNVTTSKFGLFNLIIGNGIAGTGTFSAINWGAGSLFAEVEIDRNSSGTYVSIGTTQLWSVPYALYAEKAGSLGSGSTTTGGDGWGTKGNAGTTPGTNFIGTTDDKDLSVFTNNTEKIRIKNSGNVGIGVSTPNAKLNVDGDISLDNAGATSAPIRTIGFPVANKGNHDPLIIQAKSNLNDPILLRGGDLELNAGNFNRSGGVGSYGGDVKIRAGYNVFDGSGGGNIIFYAGGPMTGPASSRGIISGTTGYFGLGTLFPSEELDVIGNIRFTGALMPAGVAGTAGQVLQSNGAGVAPTWVTPAGGGSIWTKTGANVTLVTATDRVGVGITPLADTKFMVENNASGTSVYGIRGVANPATALAGASTIGVSGYAKGTSSGEFSYGVMGIAEPASSTAVGGLFQLSNTGGVVTVPGGGSHTALYVNANGFGRSAVLQGGNVGIGTLNPVSRLHIVEETSDLTQVHISSRRPLDGGNTTLFFDENISGSGGGGAIGYDGIWNRLDLGSGFAPSLTPYLSVFTTSGNVGIGNFPAGSSPSTNAKISIKDGHIQFVQATSPTIASTGFVSGATMSAGVKSTDAVGRIRFSIPAGPGTGTVTVTFNKSFGSPPIVFINPANVAGATIYTSGGGVATATTTSFTVTIVRGVGDPAASGAEFNYMAIETEP